MEKGKERKKLFFFFFFFLISFVLAVWQRRCGVAHTAPKVRVIRVLELRCRAPVDYNMYL